MEGETPKKKRKVNWRRDAVLLLLQLVEKNKKTIENKSFNNKCSAGERQKTWDYITAEINTAFPEERREKVEIEKKWYSLRSAGKEELHKWKTEVTASCDGPATNDLSETALLVAKIIGIYSAYVSGLEGGIDTNQDEPAHERDPPTLQSDSPVVITAESSAEEELVVVTAQPAMVAQQVGDLQPPATDQQATDLQQPALGSPQASAGLASLKAAAAKKLQVIGATKELVAELELEYMAILAEVAAYR